MKKTIYTHNFCEIPKIKIIKANVSKCDLVNKIKILNKMLITQAANSNTTSIGYCQLFSLRKGAAITI